MTTELLALYRQALAIAIIFFLCAAGSQAAAEAVENNGVPLVIGNRIIHVFRAPLSSFSATERAEAARQRGSIS